MKPTDSDHYRQRKAFFRSLLTVYGRKPVLEALQSPGAKAYRLHLADSNKPAPILADIQTLAEQQGAETLFHSRRELSRISKNSKQDQGVCVDLQCPGFADAEQFAEQHTGKPFELLALDGVHNPQNLGMIIRSATAGFSDGIILPEHNSAQIDPLVIKASAGTVFKADILRCSSLAETLPKFKSLGAKVFVLSGQGSTDFSPLALATRAIFVLGNESEGVSPEVAALADHHLAIPMNNGVESLNVAVTASLLSFRRFFSG